MAYGGKQFCLRCRVPLDLQAEMCYTGKTVYVVKGEWSWTDTYSMEIIRPEDALYCLMIVLAIDAVKCSQGK